MRNEISISKLSKMTIDEIEQNDNCYLFYDWFCKDTSLKNKANRMLGIVKKIYKTKTSLVDFDNSYVFFKNNCPCYGDGRLYDSFSICDIETGDVKFFIAPRNPFGKVEICYKGHGFESDTKPIELNKLSDLYNWFKNNTEI